MGKMVIFLTDDKVFVLCYNMPQWSAIRARQEKGNQEKSRIFYRYVFFKLVLF